MAVLVSGLGRCGSTLVMTMLDAGGHPVFCGNRTSYEHDDLMPGADMGLVLPLIGEAAAKVLDPHRGMWPESLSGVKVIWLDRDFTQQAKSQAKFVTTLTGMPEPSRQHLLNIRDSLKVDTKTCLRLYLERAAYVQRIAFEAILLNPSRAAGRIADFLGGTLNVQAMEAVVIKRPLRCAPDLAIEFSRLTK